MATGAAIVAGTKAAGGLIGGYYAGKKSEDMLGGAMDSYGQAVSYIQQYMNEAGIEGQNALEFAQQMLSDWEETFGGLEQNLADYYQNLDPEKYAQQYKSDLYQNIDKQVKQLDENLAATGLQTSGMKAQTQKEAAFAKATGAAQADLVAEDKVKAMQQGFVNTGANRYSQATSNILNSYGNLANIKQGTASMLGNALTGQGNMQYNQGVQYGNSAGGFLKAGLEGFGELAGAGKDAGWWE